MWTYDFLRTQGKQWDVGLVCKMGVLVWVHIWVGQGGDCDTFLCLGDGCYRNATQRPKMPFIWSL